MIADRTAPLPIHGFYDGVSVGMIFNKIQASVVLGQAVKSGQRKPQGLEQNHPVHPSVANQAYAGASVSREEGIEGWEHAGTKLVEVLSIG